MRLLPCLIGLLLLLAAGAASCSNDNCYENSNSLPLAGFYTATIAPQQVAIDSIEVYGIGAPGDSILTTSYSSISQIYLPFRLSYDETQYVVRYLQEHLAQRDVRDTITFRYDAIPYFVSSACGTIFKFDIKEITTTGHIIDSVTCPLGVIDNQNIENLRIYLHTETSAPGT